MPVRHCLLGVKGAELCDIRHVYSHSQALMQCRDFLSSHPSWDCLPEINTAVAARNIAQRGDITCAAVASKEAAELYGLEILKENINEQSGNYTRFIVVAPRPVFVRGADKRQPVFVAAPCKWVPCRFIGCFCRSWHKPCKDRIPSHTQEELGILFLH